MFSPPLPPLPKQPQAQHPPPPVFLPLQLQVVRLSGKALTQAATMQVSNTPYGTTVSRTRITIGPTSTQHCTRATLKNSKAVARRS